MPRNGSIARALLRYTHWVNDASVLAPNNIRKNDINSRTTSITTMAYTTKTRTRPTFSRTGITPRSREYDSVSMGPFTPTISTKNHGDTPGESPVRGEAAARAAADHAHVR